LGILKKLRFKELLILGISKIQKIVGCNEKTKKKPTIFR
jgi:hypothetical protein